MCDGFGIAPYTFLSCLCVQPRFIDIYGSSGSVGTFVEGAALQEIYSILATIRGWIGTRYISLTHHVQKDYLWWGPWCAFPIHKGYYGKPAHHYSLLLFVLTSPNFKLPNYCKPILQIHIYAILSRLPICGFFQR